MRGAQNRADLREKHFRIDQAVAYRAQAERRIHRRFVIVGGQGFVCADVQRADGERLPRHGHRRIFVKLELLRFVGQVFAVHKQVFGAE